MKIGSLLVVIFLVGFGCTKESKKKNKEIIFSFKDQGAYPAIAWKVIDPPTNQIMATIQPDFGIDMKIDCWRNQIYISFGYWIVRDPDGGFNSGKLIYNLQSLSQTARHIAIDPNRNRIYWVDDGSRKIYMGSLDGSLTPTPLFGDAPVVSYTPFGFSSCAAMTIDSKNNTLYFSDTTAKIIYRADLHTPSDKPVAFIDAGNSPIGAPVDLAVSNDGKQLFWIDSTQSGVWVTNTSTKVSTQLYNSGYTEHIFYDGNNNDIYWSSNTGITRATLSSPNWQQILEADYITDFVVND
jgi:hypothetical protein